jgi:hypothetical protein
VDDWNGTVKELVVSYGGQLKPAMCDLPEACCQIHDRLPVKSGSRFHDPRLAESQPRALLRGSKQKCHSPAQKPPPGNGADRGDEANRQRIPGRHEKRRIVRAMRGVACRADRPGKEACRRSGKGGLLRRALT